MAISSITANQANVAPPAQTTQKTSEAKADKNVQKASDNGQAYTVIISQQAQQAAAQTSAADEELKETPAQEAMESPSVVERENFAGIK